MSQVTQFGEAEVDAYIRVDRRNGATEHIHVVNGTNQPITAAEYAAATQEN